MDGEKELLDAWPGFTRCVLLKESPHLCMVRGERPTRKQKTSRPDGWCVARYVEMYVRCSKKESKTKMGNRETKARQCQTIERNIYIEPNAEELKLAVRAARRKLEVPMSAAMPCKIPIKSSGETHRNIGQRKTKYACVVDADESTRPRLEELGHKPHQDHITAKGMNSMTDYSLVDKFIPMHQAVKIPRCKGSSVERMGKSGENPGMAADESQKQERSDRRSKA